MEGRGHNLSYDLVIDMVGKHEACHSTADLGPRFESKRSLIWLLPA
jgi:hypothetical protein